MKNMRRIFTFDIEVDWDRIEPFNLVIKKGSSPIQMIGCFDWFKRKFYSFFYHKDVKMIDYSKISKNNAKFTNKKIYLLLKKHLKIKDFVVEEKPFISSESKKEWDCRYLYFNNEKKMLRSFMKFVKDISPDIYHGFFVETFDLVYIINRCKSLSVGYSSLSCLGNVYVYEGNTVINGSIIYDIPALYAKFMGTHRHANSLKKIAETHLKRDDDHKITKTSESIIHEDWYEKDWKKFIEYCLIDVELCVLLEEQLGLINMCNRFEKFTGVNPIFIRYASHIIESFFNMIKPLYEKEVLKNKYNIAFPTKKKIKINRAVGAIVLESIKGFYKTGVVIILDLAKMYPKIIESLNISTETLMRVIDPKDKNKYIHCKANDVYYLKEPVGFVPFALKLLYKIRDTIEKERDQYDFGTKDYKEINEKRQTIKDSINAVSGQFDFAQSIVLEPECANSTRMTGQQEILIADKYAKLFGKKTGVLLKTIYGDTDSIFVWLKNIEDVEIAEKIGKEMIKWIQKGYDKFAEEMNIDDHKFEIGLEKIMDVFVSIGKKKKYFGHVLWADENIVEEKNSLYIKGYEARRSDSSELTNKAQKEIFSLINKTKQIGWKEIKKQILYKIREEYQSNFNMDNLLSIGIPKKLQKPFDQYKVTNPHLEGCVFANKYLQANFSAGSKPKLIYIKSVKPNKYKIPFTNHLCVEEGMEIPEEVFLIDVEKMIDKTVISKLKKTLDVVGIEETEIKDGLKQTNVLDYINFGKTTNSNYKHMINKQELPKLLIKAKIEMDKLNG